MAEGKGTILAEKFPLSISLCPPQTLPLQDTTRTSFLITQSCRAPNMSALGRWWPGWWGDSQEVQLRASGSSRQSCKL